mgnify:CR=1 FL=1
MVENFPGYRDGIMGPDLMGEMRAQAERFGTEIIQGNVTSVDALRDADRRQDGGARVHDEGADHCDRRVGAAARSAVGANADGPRRLDLRDLRRLLLPRPARSPSSAAATRRWRKRCSSRASRRRSRSCTGATRCARRRSCRTRRARTRRSRGMLEHEVEDDPRHRARAR